MLTSFLHLLSVLAWDVLLDDNTHLGMGTQIPRTQLCVFLHMEHTLVMDPSDVGCPSVYVLLLLVNE